MNETTTNDVWEDNKRRFPIGMSVTGRVVHVAAFGVFVDLGFDSVGLLRVPEMAGDKTKQMGDYPQVGQSVIARILWHDENNHQFVLIQRELK